MLAPDTARAPGRVRRLAGAAARRGPASLQVPALTYLACQSILLLWWAAFYPGLTSFDSVTYLLHVTTGPWVSNHSVLYDALLWVSLHATGGVGALTLAQTAAVAAALAYTVVAFRRLGVPGEWTAIAAVLAVMLPTLGSFVIFVWKDVPFTICAYLTVPTLAHLISLRGPGWPRGRPVNVLLIALGLELLGICLLRPDGVLVAAIGTVALMVVITGLRRRLAAAAAVAICLAITANLVIYPALGIQRANSSLVFGPAYADLAVAYAREPAAFTSADTHLMARVVPLAAWRRSADCYDSDRTDNLPGFVSHAEPLAGPLALLWLRILAHQPRLIADARACRGSIAWNIWPGPARLDGGTLIEPLLMPAYVWRRLDGNPDRSAYRPAPLSRADYQGMSFLWGASRVPQLDWLLWRGAIWCYLAYLAVAAVAIRRRNRAVLALVAFVAGQQLTVLADSPAQLFRYMVSPILAGIMLVPLFCARGRQGPGWPGS